VVSSSKIIEFEEDILGIFCSRNNSPFGYLAIVGDFRVMLYYIYDEDGVGCEIDLNWDFKYKYDRQFKMFGQIVSLDFDDMCTNFVSCTNLGYLCKWNFKDQELAKSYKVLNPITQRPVVVDMVLNLSYIDTYIAYSSRESLLLVLTDQD
jgi:hypothetical protein